MIITSKDHNYFYLYKHNLLLENFNNAIIALKEFNPSFSKFSNDNIVKIDFPNIIEDNRGVYGLLVLPLVHNYKNIDFLIKELNYLKPKKEGDLEIDIVRKYFSAKTPSNKLKISFLDKWDILSNLNDESSVLFQNTSPMVYRHDRCLSLDGLLLNKNHDLKRRIEYKFNPNLYISFYDLKSK